MLEFKDINITHSGINIVKSLYLKADDKKITLLIGKNGSGKTSILKYIVDSKKSKILNGRLSYVPVRDNGFYPLLTGKENILFFAHTIGFTATERIEKWSSLTLFQEILDKKFIHYSIGMKQVLNLFILTLGNPKYILLDEPFKHLDPSNRNQILEILLKEFQSSTFIITSHELDKHWPDDLNIIKEDKWL